MKIKGKAMWASVLAPNTKYEPVYQIDLVITDEQVKGVEKLGLKVKKKPDVGNVVTFKRPQFRKKDRLENPAPAVVDADREPFRELIGNGSDVIVQFAMYEWKNSYGSGVGADLQGVQVINHVPVEGARAPDGAEFEAVDDVDDVVDDALEAAKGKKAPQKKAPAKADDDYDDDLPDIL